MQNVPTLVGTAGHVEGQEMKLEYGRTIVVGRSRSADLSLRRMPSVAELSDEQREDDHNLRTVSGKHVEITMYNLGSIEVVNLSPNGTYVDEKLIDKIILEDVSEKSHEIRVGSNEVFRIEMKAYEDASEGEPGPEAADEPEAADKPEESADAPDAQTDAE